MSSIADELIDHKNVVLVEVASADCRLISFSTAADNVIDRDLG